MAIKNFHLNAKKAAQMLDEKQVLHPWWKMNGPKINTNNHGKKK